MAWETRRRLKRYYYRSIRQGERVHKQFCGRGERGALAAEIDLLRRLAVQEQKEAFAQLLQEASTIAGLLEQLALRTDSLLQSKNRPRL